MNGRRDRQRQRSCAELSQKGSRIAEVVELPVFSSVRTLDGDLLALAGAVVVGGRINQLSVVIEDDLSAFCLNLPDVPLQIFESALSRIRGVDRIAGIHAFRGPAEQEEGMDPGLRRVVIRLFECVVGEEIFSILMMEDDPLPSA